LLLSKSIIEAPCRFYVTTMTLNDNATSQSKRVPQGQGIFHSFKFKEDYRSRLPTQISRFIGYRDPNATAPYDPLPFPPFTWLEKIPLRVEVWLFAWIGSFGAILLIEAIMSTSTVFREVYRDPLIITSFGASSVLLFGVVESPFSQPRSLVVGHFISALVGVCSTRLFALNPNYKGYLENKDFHGTTFINGGLTTATALLAQLMLGAVHPP
jgi:hypothetical protein